MKRALACAAAFAIAPTLLGAVITGTLTGSDGRPLSRAEIELVLPDTAGAVPAAVADADGRFTLQTDRKGFVYAEFTGADHARRVVGLMLEANETIALDVRLRPKDDGVKRESVVRFLQPQSIAARFARIYDDMIGRRDQVSAARRSYLKTGKPAYTFSYDYSRDLRELTRAIDAETDPVLRSALLISYLDLGLPTDGATLSRRIAQKALAQIDPTSTLWSIDPYLLRVALRSSGSESKHADYVRAVIERHPDASTRRIVRATMSPSRPIMPGKPVPPFRLSAFHDPQIVHTPDTLRGKVYLLDFWATYCVPCVEELPNMRRMYASYRERGFEILSISLDGERETVTKFFAAGHTMPWLQAILDGGTKNPLMKEFEIVGIPTAVLVGRKGEILATSSDLRGRSLERTLARAMAVNR